MPGKVKNFKYNGFFGKTLKGYTKYKATFLSWTNDPGVAKFQCSDGVIRNIPTFALNRQFITTLPQQILLPNSIGGKGDIFGLPSKS